MRGITLVELLVALTVIGLVLGVSGLALGSLRATPESQVTAELKRARAEAVHEGMPVSARGARFLPDGRAIGVGFDQLTGLPLAK